MEVSKCGMESALPEGAQVCAMDGWMAHGRMDACDVRGPRGRRMWPLMQGMAWYARMEAGGQACYLGQSCYLDRLGLQGVRRRRGRQGGARSGVGRARKPSGMQVNLDRAPH